MIKFLPSLFTLLYVAADVLSPTVQAYVSAHPVLNVVVLGLWGVMKHLLNSPLAQTEAKPEQ